MPRILLSFALAVPLVLAAVPVPAGGMAFRSISVGGESTCGVGYDDGAYCWGSNRQLQLGIAPRTTDEASHPMPTRVALSRPSG